MDLYTACATFGFACVIYAISRLLSLIAQNQSSSGKPSILSRILIILSMLLCLFSIPAVVVFGILDRLADDLRAQEREMDRRKLHTLINMATKPRKQQIADAKSYFDYRVAVSSDFDFDDFVSDVLLDIFSARR